MYMVLLGPLLLGFIGDNGKENGNYYSTVVHWGYIRIMENKMETFGIIQGLYRV